MSLVLAPEEFISGLFSLLYVIVTFCTGGLVFSRYFKYKEKVFIPLGIACAGITCPWWASSVSFIWILLFQQPISPQAYFIIGNAFAAPLTFSWIIAMNIILFEGKNRKFLIIYAIFFTVFEILFFILLFLAPHLIGTVDPNGIDVEYTLLIMGFLAIIVMTVFTTGLMVVKNSLKATNPEIKLKGKLLLIAFLIWPINAILDGAINLHIIILVIVRIFLITSAVVFYIGWIMPEFAKKFFKKIGFLKEEK